MFKLDFSTVVHKNKYRAAMKMPFFIDQGLSSQRCVFALKYWKAKVFLYHVAIMLFPKTP